MEGPLWHSKHHGMFVWLIVCENLMRLVILLLAMSDAWSSWREWDFLVFAISQGFLMVNFDSVVMAQDGYHDTLIRFYDSQIPPAKGSVVFALVMDYCYLIRTATDSHPHEDKVFIPTLVLVSFALVMATARLHLFAKLRAKHKN